jgi:hypothetical protein
MVFVPCMSVDMVAAVRILSNASSNEPAAGHGIPFFGFHGLFADGTR